MEELDLKELFQIVWTKKIAIIIIVGVMAIIGYFYSVNYVVPLYRSSTTLILGRISTDGSVYENRSEEKQITDELSVNSKLIATYSELVKSESMLNDVKEHLSKDISTGAIRGSVSVTTVTGTELIKIAVTYKDPETASEIANVIADVFGKKVEEIYKISNVYIIDEANPSYSPCNINRTKDVLIFSGIGLIISAAYILLIYIFDTTIKSSADMENITNIKNLICIPYNSMKSELITYDDSKSIVSEAFRTLRTNVQFSSISDKKTKTYLITSCFQSEGKSYIAANLAVAFAQAGKRVILVDSDMRRGRQAKVFSFPNELGLSNYISNIAPDGTEINYNITQFIKETSIKNLNIITSGNVPPNPSELLGSPKVQELIEDLKEFYDVIIFDGAPVLPITDSLILTRLLDSTLLVARYNKTKKDDLQKAKTDIESVGGKLIGTCLNAVSTKTKTGDMNYYYYYGEPEHDGLRGKIEKAIKKYKRTIKKCKKVSEINKKKNENKPRIIDEVNLTKKPVVKDGNRRINNKVNESELGLNSLDNIIKNSIEEKEYEMAEDFKNKLYQEEQARIIEEQIRDAQIAQKNQQDRMIEEQRIFEQQRIDEKRMQEELRIAEERRQEELKIAEEKRKEEERLRKEEEARRIEEEKRLEEERRIAEEKRQEELRIAEEKRQEELRIAEEKRKEEERLREEERQRKLEEKRKKKEERKQKVQEKIDNFQNKVSEIKEGIEKKQEERMMQKAERKIKLMEEQAKLAKEKLQKAEEERNKMFGKRIMFEIDGDEVEEVVELDQESNKPNKNSVKEKEKEKKEDKKLLDSLNSNK